jgi:5'-nucleotidase
MNHSHRYQILLTNDDGIESPGLWAAASALAQLGFVTVVAPREQASSTGRSAPSTSGGRISRQSLNIRGQSWEAYAVDGTPTQAVLHAVLEIMPQRPDLVVSGINYGENVGTGVTMSGTVGAALEAAALGIPAIAVSRQLNGESYLSHSPAVDFGVAGYFTRFFAERVLQDGLLPDVGLLKLEVPDTASENTDWRITRLAPTRYFVPYVVREGDWNSPAHFSYNVRFDPDSLPHDSDVYVMAVEHLVSVTPLSLDLTSRVDFDELYKHLAVGVMEDRART